MKDKKFRTLYLLSLLLLLLLYAYPLFMGGRVTVDMLRDGAVRKENYPKYVIPYTPISIAVLFGAALLPLWRKIAKRFSTLLVCTTSVGVFAGVEALFENCLILSEARFVPLEGWQMYMCAFQGQVVQANVPLKEILDGNYSPTFKLHFYMVSVLLILGFLGTLCTAYQVVLDGKKEKIRPLLLQGASTLLFLGMCVWACFTAFYRDGYLDISALSAGLMTVFFLLLGIVGGTWLGSLLYGKSAHLSVLLPALLSSLLTLGMYLGELCLLRGQLYRLGTSLLFQSLSKALPFSPFDLLTILAGGMETGALLWLIAPKEKRQKKLLLPAVLLGIAVLLISLGAGYACTKCALAI